jgi:uncharacterized repeat protein (TIGR01451 family)
MTRREKDFSNPARNGDVLSGLSWAEERQGSTVSLSAMSNMRSADFWRCARPLFLRGLVSILVACVLLSPAKAQFQEQASKLEATVSNPSPPPSTLPVQANQGSAVAVSRDGNTMLVGGPTDSSGAGAVWVWTRSSGSWSQGSKLTGAGGSFGSSVALSADGTTAIIGAPAYNTYVGAVWIFTISGGSGSQQAGPLTAVDATGAARQGWSVAISADGNTAIVGGPHDGDPNYIGASYVFVRSGTSWGQQGAKLVDNTHAVGNAAQGYSVGLSSDGNTAIVGGPNDSSNTGAAWVFKRSGRVWSQATWVISSIPYYKLVGTGALGAARQGWSVAISGDGNTAIVGGLNDSSQAGAAWVFLQSSGAWTQQCNKLVGTTSNGPSGQGSAVALSYDGNTAIVGGPWDNCSSSCPGPGVGAVWFFTRSSNACPSTWSQSSQQVGSNSWSGASEQGYSVAMSADGGTAVVGGPDDSDGTTANLGAVWVDVAPDLAVSVTDSGNFARGDTGDTFTVTVDNTGAASTSGPVTVTVALSSGLSATGILGTNWTTCNLATLTCSRNDALAGAGGSYDPITVTVSVSINATSSQTCTATVSGGGEVDTGNDSATDDITLPPVPDLIVSVSHLGNWYQGEANVVSNIRVVNIGSGPTTAQVNLSDTLTGGLTNAAISSDSGWSCNSSFPASCSRSDPLAAGSSYPAITVTMNVASNAAICAAAATANCRLHPGSCTCEYSHAHVSGGGELNAPAYTGNDDGYDYTIIGSAASGPDMTVTSQHFGTFTRNAKGTYVITATNSGGSATSGTVTVTDTLPSGMTVSSFSAPGWTCTSGGTTLSCSRSDTLAAGLSYRAIILTVSVGAGTASSVTNTVNVSGGGEVTTSNDTGTDPTLVTG